MRRSLILVAGYVVLFASAPIANAAPTYSVFNCAQPSGTPLSTPQTIDATCSYSNHYSQTAAVADAGSVGAYAKTVHIVANDTDATGSAGAVFYTDEIVISKLPSAGSLPDLVYAAMRFDVDGVLEVDRFGQASGFGQASAQFIGALGNSSGNTSFRNNSGSMSSEIYVYDVIENNSSGNAINLVLETQPLLVRVGDSIGASLSINVSTFVRNLNEATSDFVNTATFAVGRDVFAFYDATGNPVTGYTANAGDYLINNRFGAVDVTIPEPATRALLGLVLAGLAASRGRKR